MKDDLYWLWLQKSLGYGADIADLMRYFGSARGLYEAGETAWRKSGLFSSGLLDTDPVRISKMRATSLYAGEKIVEQCRRENISIVTPEDEAYPKLLLRIRNFPAVLFVRGDLSFVNRMMPIAVVGTRKPSQYGREAAGRIAEGLVSAGAAVISGGALGVDSIAHTAAVEQGGKTAMVLGCGIGYGYLKENEALRQAVSESGAVVSEYLPGSASALTKFPMRNRIISGMSRGVAIVEAGEKSGTLNTARHARQQNRELFVVPGDISSVTFSGSNQLIREGAKSVFSANDILSYYSMEDKAIEEIEHAQDNEPFSGTYGRMPQSAPAKSARSAKPTKRKPEKPQAVPVEPAEVRAMPSDVSDNAKTVFTLLSQGKTELDILSKESGLDARELLIALTELEMEGVAESLGGGRYALC